jgi:hypothetical protein
LRVDHDDVAILDHASLNEGTTSGENVYLARELSGALHGNSFFAKDAGPHDLDGAREDYVDAQSRSALLVKDFPDDGVSPRTVSSDPLKLSLGQLREDLGSAFCANVAHGAGVLLRTALARKLRGMGLGLRVFRQVQECSSESGLPAAVQVVIHP